MGIISWIAIMGFLALIFTGNQLEPVVVRGDFVYTFFK